MESGAATGRSAETRGLVTVRYWAAARAAAGVTHDDLEVTGPLTLADVRRQVLSLHPDGRFEAVLGVCSVLVGDRPAGTADAEAVEVFPGDRVEFLPPFAGG